MRWASTVSAEPDLANAVREASSRVRVQLDDVAPDLIVVFVSAHHRAHFERLPEEIAAHVGGGQLIGCSAGGVIGGGKEIEQRPGLSMTVAVVPGVELTPFHLDSDALPQRDDASGAWQRLVGVAVERDPHFILLPDPFTFDVEKLVRALDQTYPRSRKIGGLSSGGRQPEENALFLGGTVYRSGLVGMALAGNIELDTVVAQGCRPIGQPMFVTSCHANRLRELDGQPALHVLHQLYEQLDAHDQELAQHSLFLGIVMNAHRHHYRQGDFLIRNLIGLDPERAALVVGALLRENSVVQFHLRDARTSAQDLDQLLTRYVAAEPQRHPNGALLFSCLGRGMSLYGRADHDTDAFRRHLGDTALGGFFCNGEIGPVDGTTFLHGYTSAFGLFREKR